MTRDHRDLLILLVASILVAGLAFAMSRTAEMPPPTGWRDLEQVDSV